MQQLCNYFFFKVQQVEVTSGLTTTTWDHTSVLPSFKLMSSLTARRGICQDKSFQMPLIMPIVRWFIEDQVFSRIPLWISGKYFVTELAHLFKVFETEHTLEAFAMKTAITLPVLRLKMSHAKSKVHDHILSPTLTHIMEKERHTRYL